MRIAVCFKNNRVSQQIASNCCRVSEHECIPVNFSKMSNPNTIKNKLNGFEMVLVNELDNDIMENLNDLKISFKVLKNMNTYVKPLFERYNFIRYELNLNRLLQQFKFVTTRYRINSEGYPVKVSEYPSSVNFETYEECLEQALIRCKHEIQEAEMYKVKMIKRIENQDKVARELIKIKTSL